MCEHGQTTIMRVRIDASLSHTGATYWKDVSIDRCIAPLVQALQNADINMLASCCGHGRTYGRIDLTDGRVLFIAATPPEPSRDATGWQPIKLGVVHFHPQEKLRERFYYVVNDLREAGCIVDLWLLDISSVLKEFGYEMTIRKASKTAAPAKETT